MSLADGPKAREALRKWQLDRLAQLAPKLSAVPGVDNVDPMGRALDRASEDDEQHDEQGRER